MKALSVGLALALALIAAPASATVVDSCNQEFTYTKSVDYGDERVDIDFTNTGSQGNPDTVAVNAQSGYELVSVHLDVQDDGQGGFVDYSEFFPGTKNPIGFTITSAKVVVKKVCEEPIDVCLNIEGNQTIIPEGYESLSEGQCTLIPPPPVDVCDNLEGNQESVPEGYTESEGVCTPVEQPQDACPDMEGFQSSVEECPAPEETPSEPESTGGGSVSCPKKQGKHWEYYTVKIGDSEERKARKCVNDEREEDVGGSVGSANDEQEFIPLSAIPYTGFMDYAYFIKEMPWSMKIPLALVVAFAFAGLFQMGLIAYGAATLRRKS